MSIFVSSQDIVRDPSSALVSALRNHGLRVLSSPANPDQGSDMKWGEWYDSGLNQAVSECSVFVAVVVHAWDSSSWMAEESRIGHLHCDAACFWNPNGVIVEAEGMLGYLKDELPTDLDAAVAEIAARAA